MTDLFGTTAQPLFEEYRAEYLAEMRSLALRIWNERRPYAMTVNDLRQDKRFHMPPDIDPRVLGAVFKTSDWEVIEYGSNPRKECHGRPVARFRRV